MLRVLVAVAPMGIGIEALGRDLGLPAHAAQRRAAQLARRLQAAIPLRSVELVLTGGDCSLVVEDPRHRLRFDTIELSLRLGLCWIDGRPVRLAPHHVPVLGLLMRRAHAVVPLSELCLVGRDTPVRKDTVGRTLAKLGTALEAAAPGRFEIAYVNGGRVLRTSVLSAGLVALDTSTGRATIAGRRVAISEDCLDLLAALIHRAVEDWTTIEDLGAWGLGDATALARDLARLDIVLRESSRAAVRIERTRDGDVRLAVGDRGRHPAKEEPDDHPLVAEVSGGTLDLANRPGFGYVLDTTRLTAGSLELDRTAGRLTITLIAQRDWRFCGAAVPLVPPTPPFPSFPAAPRATHT